MSKWAWCLVNDDGTLATGWNQVGDYWYYLYSNGQMACDEWIKLNDIWYRVNEKGQMVIGWWQNPSTEKWFYLIEEGNPSQGEYKGQMVANCTRDISGKTYSFNADGSMVDSLISDECAKFIASWEGFYSKAYEDPYYPGNKAWWTIGYGTTYAVTPDAFTNGLNSTCTKEQALEWLKDEMKSCAKTIKEKLVSSGVSLNQNEFDALVSFAYNCGTGALFGSTLWKNVIVGVKDSDSITANFKAWSKANGQTSQGLLRRRLKEAAMFINGDYTGNV